MTKLDASRRRVFAELIRSSRVAGRSGRRYRSARHRVREPRQQSSSASRESLVALITWFSPLPKCLTDDELDEFEELYLWKMIGQYVHWERCCRKDRDRQGGRLGGPSVCGLNDSQVETVLDLFGPEATGARSSPRVRIRMFLLLSSLGRKRLQNNVNIMIPRGPRY